MDLPPLRMLRSRRREGIREVPLRSLTRRLQRLHITEPLRIRIDSTSPTDIRTSIDSPREINLEQRLADGSPQSDERDS